MATSWTAVILPVVGVLALGLAAQWGWTSEPTIAAIAEWVEETAKLLAPWYPYFLVGVVCLTIGLLLDRFTRKRASEDSRKLVIAGRAIHNLLVRVDRPGFRVDEHRVAVDFLGSATAIGAQMDALGILFPDVPEDQTAVQKQEYVSHFFRLVGATFRTGDLKASREIAREATEDIEAEIRRI